MREIAVHGEFQREVESVGVVGTARERGPARRPLADRLWEKINKDGPFMPGMDSPCWIFEGCRSEDGYGGISIGGHCGKMMRAHRAAWLVTHGDIPAGIFVCHKCDHPPCCRPDHLFLGTQSDNMLDAAAKGRLSVSRLVSRNLGELNGRAILTWDQAGRIRDRYAAGEWAAALASEFGVSRETIYALGQGRTWKAA